MGAFLNGLLIIIGAIVGLIIGGKINSKVQNQIMQAMGLAVIYISISSMLKMQSTLNMLISLAIGTAIGAIIDLDGLLIKLGNNIEKKIGSKYPIAIGFINASLLFCVGGMAIVGSFSDGLTGDYSTLLMKGVIDGISAIVFTSKYGIGVFFSALLVFIYEGLLTLFASVISPILTETAILQLSSVGSLVLLAVGYNLLTDGKLKPMNMVPSIFVSIIVSLLFAYFNIQL